jgi:hypothetical protein
MSVLPMSKLKFATATTHAAPALREFAPVKKRTNLAFYILYDGRIFTILSFFDLG